MLISDSTVSFSLCSIQINLFSVSLLFSCSCLHYNLSMAKSEFLSLPFNLSILVNNTGVSSSEIHHSFPPIQSICAPPEVSMNAPVLVFGLGAHHLASFHTSQCYLSRLLAKALRLAMHSKN